MPGNPRTGGELNTLGHRPVIPAGYSIPPLSLFSDPATTRAFAFSPGENAKLEDVGHVVAIMVVGFGSVRATGPRTAPGNRKRYKARSSRWVRAVCRRPAPGVRTAWANARRDPASTINFLARVMPV